MYSTLKGFGGGRTLFRVQEHFVFLIPGFERQREPWVFIQNCALNPEKGSPTDKPFQGSEYFVFLIPGLSLALQPWA
jgi:hypothetical protein